MVLVPLLFALAMRFIMPPLFDYLGAFLQIDLEPYFLPIVGFILAMLTPALVGVVIGFLLLDERDDRTLSALQVTPLPLGGYLAYRLLIPVGLSVLLTVIVFPLAGLNQVGFWDLLAVALAGAPYAPIFALFLATFAQNKVQGFALQKASGVIGLPPVLAYFVSMPWQLAFGIAPTYWPAKVWWLALEGDPGVWLAALVGVVYQSLLVVLLLRRFNRIIHRGD
jgi:fluoroquinolone transport system permease protein